MHAAVADYDGERDRITVHASTQVPYYVHLMLSQILGMDMSRIRVIKPHVGGGFGCRTETLNVELIAALLARHLPLNFAELALPLDCWAVNAKDGGAVNVARPQPSP